MTKVRQADIRDARPRRGGFTLTELVLSMTVMTILVGGMASAIVVATQAIDDGSSPDVNTLQAADLVAQISADTSFALAFTERMSTSLAFTVPDRDGDKAPDTIRYAWSGKGGDPLTREYNGGTPLTVVDEVYNFNLDYLMRRISPPPGACCLPDGSCVMYTQEDCEAIADTYFHGEGIFCDKVVCPQESAEIVLAFHDDASGGVFKDYHVEASRWPGAYFKLSLPANTLSWKITRAMFVARRHYSADATMEIQIRPADYTGVPSSTVLEGVRLDESALPEVFEWVGVAFTSVAGLSAISGMCLVLTQATPTGKAAEVQYEENWLPTTPDSYFVYTENAGTWWFRGDNTTDLRFYIYGTVTTLGTPQW